MEKRIISPEEMLEQMRAFEEEDNETRHRAGDELLCKVLRQLGYGEAVDEFEKWDKWYV